MTVYIGADHRGFEMKNALAARLKKAGYTVIDTGALQYNKADDYVDVVRAMMGHLDVTHDKGILLCGSGHGVDIVANRYPKVRSILGFNNDVVVQGRAHEDANVLSLPAEWVDEKEAWKRVKLFLNTPFSGKARYVRRISKLSEI